MKRIQGSPYVRYAAYCVPESGRIASRQLIHHHVQQAHERKAWATTITQEWRDYASDMSRKMVDDLLRYSVHVIARRSLEYHRLRAHFMLHGYPLDKQAFELWNALSAPGGATNDKSTN